MKKKHLDTTNRIKNIAIKSLKRSIQSVLVFLIIGICYLNFSMYYAPKFRKSNDDSYNLDVYHQLIFLKKELRDDAGVRMQKLFPEGFMFINSLYGLAWVNLIQDIDKDSALFNEGINEINWSIQQINSTYAKQIFDKDLPLEYGAFYKGWSNYVLGSKLKILSEPERDSSEINLFKSNCNQIIEVTNHSDSPYIESYRKLTWPADITVAMASVSIHDQIFEPQFQKEIKKWVSKVKQNLDPKTNLIPHAVHSITGQTIESARGSSQSLMLNFLIDIDQEFAKKQFEIYKTLFLDSRFGLPGIREYPKGTKNYSDIDSGPVLLGIGGSASIVGQRTMGKFKNWNTYQGLRNSIEGFGSAYTYNSTKMYIFGQLPMADAFIAWSNSLERNQNQVQPESNWRLYFQLLSCIIIIIFGFLIKKL
ncbi:hypothetical protein [Aquimarina algicola]|uniref:DUF3131 domain-containing protein n=1 Tax=Aquimarina algicola TaxID=2589995 RepID=A0A504JN46_9FLAO|nr:hypothetical protein [Aquimarina algicola]TPN89123.1 hypothetical protein FHK87_02560 [Aquimarina algicola]